MNHTAYLTLGLSMAIALIRPLVDMVRGRRLPSRAAWLTLVVLLILTAVFDNVIIGLGIVTYDPAKILGFYVGRAPIEDFFYAVFAAVIVPVLWNERRRRG